MGLLSFTVRGAELQKPTHVLLERPYKFTKLKLLHIYHNIDSINLSAGTSKAGGNAAEQVQLFIKLGGLVENAKQIINYVGDYESSVSVPLPNVFSKTDRDYEAKNENSGTPSQTSSVTQRTGADININHLIPIGGSRHSSHELISRDVFKTLHEDGVLNFSGELLFQLFFMDRLADIVPFSTTTGGIDVGGVSTTNFRTFITMLFEYEE